MKIRCPACGFENEKVAKFCSNCNEPLVAPKNSINNKNSYIKKETSNNNTENTNIKSIIKKERLRMNKKQRVILAIFIPVLLFFITLTIAYDMSVETVVITPGYWEPGDRSSEIYPPLHRRSYRQHWFAGDEYHPDVIRRYHRPFDLQKTWYVWLLFLTFCCFFEYKLFGDKEAISNKKNKELR